MLIVTATWFGDSDVVCKDWVMSAIGLTCFRSWDLSSLGSLECLLCRSLFMVSSFLLLVLLNPFDSGPWNSFSISHTFAKMYFFPPEGQNLQCSLCPYRRLDRIYFESDLDNNESDHDFHNCHCTPRWVGSWVWPRAPGSAAGPAEHRSSWNWHTRQRPPWSHLTSRVSLVNDRFRERWKHCAWNPTSAGQPDSLSPGWGEGWIQSTLTNALFTNSFI